MRTSEDEGRSTSVPRHGARFGDARRLRHAARAAAALHREARRGAAAPRRAHDGESLVRRDARRPPGREVRRVARGHDRVVSHGGRARRRPATSRKAARLLLPRPAASLSQGPEADLRPRRRRAGGHGRLRAGVRRRASAAPDARGERRAVHDALRARRAADPPDARRGIWSLHALVQLAAGPDDAESNVRARRHLRRHGVARPLLLASPRRDDLRPPRQRRPPVARLLPRRAPPLDHGRHVDEGVRGRAPAHPSLPRGRAERRPSGLHLHRAAPRPAPWNSQQRGDRLGHGSLRTRTLLACQRERPRRRSGMSSTHPRDGIHRFILSRARHARLFG